MCALGAQIVASRYCVSQDQMDPSCSTSVSAAFIVSSYSHLASVITSDWFHNFTFAVGSAASHDVHSFADARFRHVTENAGMRSNRFSSHARMRPLALFGAAAGVVGSLTLGSGSALASSTYTFTVSGALSGKLVFPVDQCGAQPPNLFSADTNQKLHGSSSDLWQFMIVTANASGGTYTKFGGPASGYEAGYAYVELQGGQTNFQASSGKLVVAKRSGSVNAVFTNPYATSGAQKAKSTITVKGSWSCLG